MEEDIKTLSEDLNKSNLIDEIVKDQKGEDRVIKLSKFSEISKHLGTSYSTGFTLFDEAMNGGFREGNLVIISGVSGQGKTALSQSFTYYLCKKDIKVLWFSYEVAPEYLNERFLSMGIKDFYHVYTPKKNTTGRLDWVKKKILHSMVQFKTKVVVIDHIDFLIPSTSKSSDNEAIALKNVAKELKELAVEYNITIILMAHLKKLTDDNKEPSMQDIGYCLPAKSFILNSDNGEFIDIKKIYNNKIFNVVSLNNNLKQENKLIKDVYKNGIKDVYKIETDSGYEIEATSGHRFFKDLDWVKLKDLKVGDYLTFPGKLPSYNNNDYKIELIELIGWMLGDGYFPKHGTGELVLQDDDDLKYIEKLLKKIDVLYDYKKYSNWIVVKFKTRKNKYDKFINNKKSNELKDIIKKMRLDNMRGDNKKIPKELFNQDNKIISVLLRGLFQSDGTVSNINLGRNRLVVEFANISKGLVFQIKLLLLRFGIRSSIRKTFKNNKYAYKVIIEGKTSVLEFHKNIKLVNKKGKYIQRMVNYIKTTNLVSGKSENYKYLPPMYKEMFFLNKNKSGVTWDDLKFRITHHQKTIKKTQWNKFCKLSKIGLVVPEDIDFDKIKSIKYVGKKMVYDIEVKDNHNFICNGFYTHNSAGIFQLADYVMLIWRMTNPKNKEDENGDIYSNYSKIKIVKNRLTGRTVFQKVVMHNNLFSVEDTLHTDDIPQ